ncbi:MAG: response regulator transcription factor [Chloroflexota bacterium]|nr:response regulator transcription factor [Chloroflexota bacterium]
MAQDRVPLLAVDDDARILKLVQLVLEEQGYAVQTAANGQEALTILGDARPALVFLDVNMPGMDGFTVCQRIRLFSQVPIIMVTAKGSEGDRVKGFEAGADDYVTKPFSPRELVARVRAVLRRANAPAAPEEPSFRIGELEVDFNRRRVALSGRELLLTATEHRLLTYLAHNAGRILTPDQILEHVWGEEYLGDLHLLRVAIARLRQRLGDDAKKARYIVTRQGIGYTMPSA